MFNFSYSWNDSNLDFLRPNISNVSDPLSRWNDYYQSTFLAGYLFINMCVLLGISENILVLYVYVGGHLDIRGYRFFIAVRAVLDLLGCISMMLLCTLQTSLFVRFPPGAWCKFLNFTCSFLSFSSSFVVLAISIQQYRIRFGQSKGEITLFWRLVALLIILTFSAVCAAPLLYFSDTDDVTWVFEGENVTGTVCYVSQNALSDDALIYYVITSLLSVINCLSVFTISRRIKIILKRWYKDTKLEDSCRTIRNINNQSCDSSTLGLQLRNEAMEIEIPDLKEREKERQKLKKNETERQELEERKKERLEREGRKNEKQEQRDQEKERQEEDEPEKKRPEQQEREIELEERLAEASKMTIESIIALATVLYNNKTLKALNINRPILFTQQEETTVHYAKLLKVNMSLEEIHLQKYDMRDFGATRLAENLMHNFTLVYLDLSCNRITRDGTLELAKVLKQNTALKVLDLGYNRLEDDGAMHIAEALSTYNTNLETLVVTYNNIGSKGLCALADSMKVNTSLMQIYIWGNKLEEPACIAFANLLECGRLEPQNTDIRSYIVDGVTMLCELNNSIRRHYYHAPSYGDDVPSWQPRGDNPRGSDIVTVKDLTVY